MIFTTFPDLRTPSPQRSAFFSAYGKTHLVINAIDDGVAYERHPTPLTVKWVRSGRETYFLEGRTVTVVPGNYLMINAGTEYGSEIARGTRTSSFSAFFEPGAARDVAATLHAGEDRLLAELSPAAPDAFFERLEPDHGRVGALSSEADRSLFVRLRGLADAVLVGAATVRAEGYGPVKLPESRRVAREAEGDLSMFPAKRCENASPTQERTAGS